MFWKRKRPARPVNPHAAEIRVARRQIRGIDWQLNKLDPRVPGDLPEVRRLADIRMRWVKVLAGLGVNEPMYPYTW